MAYEVQIGPTTYPARNLLRINLQQGFTGYDNSCSVEVTGILAANIRNQAIIIRDTPNTLATLYVTDVTNRPFERITTVEGKANQFTGQAMGDLMAAISSQVPPLLTANTFHGDLNTLVSDTITNSEGEEVTIDLTEKLRQEITQEKTLQGALKILERYALTLQVTTTGINIYPNFTTDNRVDLVANQIFAQTDLDVERLKTQDNPNTTNVVRSELLKRRITYRSTRSGTLEAFPRQATNPEVHDPSPVKDLKTAVQRATAQALINQLEAVRVELATPLNLNIRARTHLTTVGYTQTDWQVVSARHIIGGGLRETQVVARNRIVP